MVTAVTVVLNGLLFRHLGVEFGTFILVWTSSTRFDFFEDSLGSFIVRTVAHRQAPDAVGGRDQHRDVGAAAALYALLAVVSATVLFVGLVLILVEYPNRVTAATLGAVGLALGMIGRVVSKGLEGAERYIALRTIQSGASLMSLAVAAFLVAREQASVESLLAALIMIQGLAGVVMAWSLSRNLPLRVLIPPTDTIRRWPHIFRFMRPLLVAKGAAIVSYRLDLWIVQGLVGPTGTAVYAVGEAVASLAAQAIEVFKAILPVSIRDASRGARWRREFATGTTKITGATVGLVSLLLIVSARPVIEVWFGSVSETAVWVARILLVFYALTSFRSPVQTILVGRDRFHLLERPFLAAGVINVIASLVLAAGVGTTGPAMGTLIAGVLLLLTNTLISESELGMPRWSMMRRVVVPGLLSLATAVATGLVMPALTSPVAEIVVRSAVSGATFAFLLWWALLTTSERSMLRAKFRELVGG